MFRNRTRLIALGGAVVVLCLFLSLALQLDLPKPTGPYTVGRTTTNWVDASRSEVITADPNDTRELPTSIWYPAETGTGTKATYFPNLDQVAQNLSASGEVGRLEVAGLPLIRSNSYENAAVSNTETTYPVLLLSPGNGTNVEFYAALADELASHGYVVVGLNHPYDGAAVSLSNGRVAQFAAVPPSTDREANQTQVRERIDVRTADALFALDQLQTLNADPENPLAGRLDLTRVGIMGHSLGGITAAQACQQDPRLKACLNLDGLQEGGAFSAHRDPQLPTQPFMFITKEEEMMRPLVKLFEALPSESYQVTIHGATHDSFTDGPLLLPSLLPITNKADRIHTLTREYTLAFFDQVLNGQSNPLLATPLSDGQVSVEIYRPS